MTDVLIKNAQTVLTMNNRREVLQDVDLRLKDGVIAIEPAVIQSFQKR